MEGCWHHTLVLVGRVLRELIDFVLSVHIFFKKMLKIKLFWNTWCCNVLF